MEDVKKAVDAARVALPEYIGISPENVRVEEVRLDGQDILVGLSFLETADPSPIEEMEQFSNPLHLKRKERVFRRFRVTDGAVVAMERVEQRVPNDREDVLEGVRGKVRRYQAGILLDTNMALLHVLYKALGIKALSCGLVNVYTEEHVAVLDTIILAARHVSVTPHVLTELDYFIRERVGKENRQYGHQTYVVLRYLAQGWREPVRPGRELVADELAFRIGVADLSQTTLRRRRRLMITDDMRLMRDMEGRNMPYLNPTNYLWQQVVRGGAGVLDLCIEIE